MASVGGKDPERSENAAIRRRRHHLRSRNGCATCKERHIRCDERIPFCRNCVRVGRACFYTIMSTPQSSASVDPENVDNPTSLRALLHHTSQSYDGGTSYQNIFSDHQPWKQDISNIAFWIVQQSRQVSAGSPRQQDFQSPASQVDRLGYNQLAQTHECVQCALTSFEAYIQYQSTYSATAKELYLSRSCMALAKLQNEVNNFSPANANAIMITSLILAAQAQDWDQWVIFMNGYSSALREIEERNERIVYPGVLSKSCRLRSDLSTITFAALSSPKSREVMRQQVQGILNAIRATTPLIAAENLQGGFQDLEKLALTVADAIQLKSSAEAYQKLAWLRSCMFWIEMRDTTDEEGLVLGCYFYALLAAVVPLFPARYSAALSVCCVERMDSMIMKMDYGSPLMSGLLRLVGWMKEDVEDS